MTSMESGSLSLENRKRQSLTKIDQMTPLKRKMKQYILIFVMSVLSMPLWAHDEHLSAIKGVVRDTHGGLIEAATVSLKEIQKGTYTNRQGKFHLLAQPGQYTLLVQFMGYKTFEKKINLSSKDHLFIRVELEDNDYKLSEVVVESKSPVQRVKESALNVVAIDTKALYNTTLDISNTLEKISGVKIRELGGVGSDSQISLNGFSGKHIKVFMDGVPMEGTGSSFQINNIPINIADRIEVYKGVVPVEFGGDALGGAINIVTKQTSNTYVDASYSYGSFNTHKSNVSVGYTARNGFNVSLNAYQNYSDNDYKVKTRLLDLETGNFSKDERWFKRFHDRYHNEALIAKVGFVNKSWADKFLLGVTVSNEAADIQNANLMRIVYGGKKRTAKGVTPSLTYSKRNLFVPNLSLSVNANYSKLKSENIDTLARQYNWEGDYVAKSSKGEGQYSMGKFNNTNISATANVSYSLLGKHFFTLNNIYTNYERKSEDAAADDTSTQASFMRRVNNKNVVGLSYKFMPISAWNILGFVKQYNTTVKGPVNISTTTTEDYVEQTRPSHVTGYGLATTYHLTPSVQLKASYEQAYRLPSERELFGDEVLETGNTKLKPEKSQNFNFNASFDHTFNDVHNIALDAGFVYRVTKDYIRRIIEQRYGGAYSTNHGQVNNIGVDFEARYSYKNALVLGGNITYQNIRNKERYSPSGQELIYYNDRVPNIPYLFGSIDASYNFKDLMFSQDALSVGYNMRYVHDFYRDWKSEGGDIAIPKQLSHNLSLTYALKNGTYNLALEANNITDEILYDNYSLQKPGRNFSVKLRYFFFRSKL